MSSEKKQTKNGDNIVKKPRNVHHWHWKATSNSHTYFTHMTWVSDLSNW
jgi:hypothetical protein